MCSVCDRGGKIPVDTLQGALVALVTLMNADVSIDLEGFRTLLQFHLENDTSAVRMMGSHDEVSMLFSEERHASVCETMRMRTGKR